MNILLSHIGGAVWFVDCFKETVNGSGIIVGTDWRIEALGLHFCDIKEIVPQCTTPGYVDAVIRLCREYKIDLLFTFDELDATILMSRKAEILSVGTFPVVADVPFLNICLNKYKTFQFAITHSIRTPATFPNLNDALNAIEMGEISFPLVVKPQFGSGSLGRYYARNHEELRFYWKISTEEIDDYISIDYSGKNLIKESSVLIQEYIHGQEYGLNILNDLKGQYVTTVAVKKIFMTSGTTSHGAVVNDEHLSQLGKKIACISQHPGLIGVDVILQDEIPFLIEMNARFTGHYPFAHAAGLNAPAALVSWGEGLFPDLNLFRIKNGVNAFKSSVIRTY